MNTLYRKVLCSERLPDEGGTFGTNKGELFFLIAVHHWFYDAKFTVEPPDWWLEEVNIPTDEEIEKRLKNIYPHWESDWEGSVRRLAFIRGFKAALELLTLQRWQR